MTQLNYYTLYNCLLETCVFAYLGMSIFSYTHKIEVSFVIWSVVVILLLYGSLVYKMLCLLLELFTEISQ